jgi:radical SAM-linked protein
MRLRITFSKNGALRYTGHLDLQTTWERTVRRAGLPLAYTHGFHPGPKIQIASALPLGFIGRAEIVDIWLEAGETSDDHEMGDHKGRPYREMLQRAAPPGLTVLSLEQVAEAGPALQTQVTSAEYEVTLLDPLDGNELAKNLATALAAESLPRQRRGKSYDLRPLIEALSLLPPALPSSPASGGEPPRVSRMDPGGMQSGQPETSLFMRLAARAGATARPEEVLDVLGIPPEAARIERTRLILAGGTG